jgi:aminopeptidase
MGMLTEIQMERYSDVLLWALKTARKERFKREELVLVRFDSPAVRLAEILHSRLLEEGLNPVLRSLWTPTMEHNLYEKGNKKQLLFVPPGEEELFKHLNGSIFIHAPLSLTHLSDIDPKKIGMVAVARKYLRDILQEREDAGRFSWTLCSFPTEEPAGKAKLSIRQYANQIVRACYLDQEDPVKSWKEIYRRATEIKRWMSRMEVKHYHVESERIDLKITPGERRKWVGISGHNMPSFEVFISPDWRGTEGIYYADQPSFRSGNYVEGVRLTFEKGIVVKTEADKNEEFVSKQLKMDKGASRVGEFSLTDRRFSRIGKFMANTLYDENYGGRYGNCHLAVGSSYSDTYAGDPGELTPEMKRDLGFNDSALHWDLVNTEKKVVTAHLRSGAHVVVYENGMFRI